VPAEKAATESAGDDNKIARLGAAAQQGTFGRRLTQHGNADRQRSIPTLNVTAGDRQIVPFGQRQQTFVQPNRQFESALPRQSQGNHGRHRQAGHGGDVAEVNGQGLVPYAACVCLPEVKVDSVADEVDGDEAFWAVGQP
jgi:hypothetical protein